jgi:MFS family permease
MTTCGKWTVQLFTHSVQLIVMQLTGFQLFFGKMYSFYSHKWVFLFGFSLFEIGSLLCGAANSSAMFIVGRAIAGLGGAGVLSGSFIIISTVVSLERRANFSALIWAMYGIASCSGPLVRNSRAVIF